MLQWSDPELDIDDISSITSEDDEDGVKLECDNDQRARPKPSQEIWNTKSLWQELMVILEILQYKICYLLKSLALFGYEISSTIKMVR